jgi:hypothetical protein
MARRLPFDPGVYEPLLRIERVTAKGSVHLVLSGRLEGLLIAEVQQAIAAETAHASRLTLDLAEVRLLDRDAVRFLVGCEAAGICLRACPAYIREWMDRERDSATS